MKVVSWDERVLEHAGKAKMLSLEQFTILLTLCRNLFQTEKKSKRRLTRSASACGWSPEMMENIMFAYGKILTDSVKAGLDEYHFQLSIKMIQLPEELAAELLKMYKECFDEIKLVACVPSQLNVPHFVDLQWRFDVQVGTRYIWNRMKPIATLCLDTVNAKKKDELPQSERIFLRTDYSNLKNLQNQLEAALAEVDSVHCSRIQRYMR